MTTMTWLASQPMICVKYLLESYSDGHTPLHTAVRKNTLDVDKGTICQIIIISKNLIFWRVIGGGRAQKGHNLCLLKQNKSQDMNEWRLTSL